jgi:hypothetical protein
MIIKKVHLCATLLIFILLMLLDPIHAVQRNTSQNTQRRSTPSLKETLDWLKEKLTEAGYTNAKSSASSKDIDMERIEGVRYEGCNISYKEISVMGNPEVFQSTFVSAIELPLKEIDPLAVKIHPTTGKNQIYVLKLYSLKRRSKFKVGRTTIFIKYGTPSSEPGEIAYTSEIWLRFEEQEMANRVAKAFIHAIKSCQAVKEPF